MSFGLNALHAFATIFLPLLARALGMGLAEIGLIRGLYSLVNAIGRPLASALITRFGASRASLGGFVVQSALTALIPLGLLAGLPVILPLYMLSGSMRAIAFTANSVALAEDVPESRLSRGISSGLFAGTKDVAVIVGPLLGSALAPVISLERTFLLVPGLLLLTQILVIYSLRQRPTSASRAA
jgi:predicted MFS family arabinose efflux permease